MTPVAQTEAMHTFLRRYDASLLDVARERLSGAVAAVTDPQGDDEQAIVRKTISEEGQRLNDHFGELSWDWFVQLMIRTVSAMPATDPLPLDQRQVPSSLNHLRQIRFCPTPDR